MTLLLFSFSLILPSSLLFFFFFNDTATTEIYTLSLHDALPICSRPCPTPAATSVHAPRRIWYRSEEHTSELQSRENLVCRLLLEKKKQNNINLFSSKKIKHYFTIFTIMNLI